MAQPIGGGSAFGGSPGSGTGGHAIGNTSGSGNSSGGNNNSNLPSNWNNLNPAQQTNYLLQHGGRNSPAYKEAEARNNATKPVFTKEVVQSINNPQSVQESTIKTIRDSSGNMLGVEDRQAKQSIYNPNINQANINAVEAQRARQAIQQRVNNGSITNNGFNNMVVDNNSNSDRNKENNSKFLESFEKKATQLEQDKQQYIKNMAGVNQRIESFANTITLGYGVPKDQRGLFGNSAENFVTALFETPENLFYSFNFGARATFLTGEALLHSETRSNVFPVVASTAKEATVNTLSSLPPTSGQNIANDALILLGAKAGFSEAKTSLPVRTVMKITYPEKYIPISKTGISFVEDYTVQTSLKELQSFETKSNVPTAHVTVSDPFIGKNEFVTIANSAEAGGLRQSAGLYNFYKSSPEKGGTVTKTTYSNSFSVNYDNPIISNVVEISKPLTDALKTESLQQSLNIQSASKDISLGSKQVLAATTRPIDVAIQKSSETIKPVSDYLKTKQLQTSLDLQSAKKDIFLTGKQITAKVTRPFDLLFNQVSKSTEPTVNYLKTERLQQSLNIESLRKDVPLATKQVLSTITKPIDISINAINSVSKPLLQTAKTEVLQQALNLESAKKDIPLATKQVLATTTRPIDITINKVNEFVNPINSVYKTEKLQQELNIQSASKDISLGSKQVLAATTRPIDIISNKLSNTIKPASNIVKTEVLQQGLNIESAKRDVALTSKQVLAATTRPIDVISKTISDNIKPTSNILKTEILQQGLNVESAKRDVSLSSKQVLSIATRPIDIASNKISEVSKPIINTAKTEALQQSLNIESGKRKLNVASKYVDYFTKVINKETITNTEKITTPDQPRAYLAYAGIGGGEYNGVKAIPLVGKPVITILLSKDTISKTPRSITKGSVKSVNAYQIQKSGETFVPAENIKGKSVEGQFITPSKYTDIEGYKNSEGSIITKTGEEKFSYYEQKKTILGVPYSDFFKVVIVETETRPVTNKIEINKPKVEITKYNKDYYTPKEIISSKYELIGSSIPREYTLEPNSYTKTSSSSKSSSFSSSMSSSLSPSLSISPSPSPSSSPSTSSSISKSPSSSKSVSKSPSTSPSSSPSPSPSLSISPSLSPSPSPSKSPSPSPSPSLSKSPSPSPSPYPQTSRSRSVIYPFYSSSRKSKLAKYKTLVRRQGVFKTISESETLQEATVKGISNVRNTAAASFKVIGPESNQRIKSIVPSNTFYESKKESGVFIQKAFNRISTPGEKRDITFKGIMKLKNRGMIL